MMHEWIIIGELGACVVLLAVLAWQGHEAIRGLRERRRAQALLFEQQSKGGGGGPKRAASPGFATPSKPAPARRPLPKGGRSR